MYKKVKGFIATGLLLSLMGCTMRLVDFTIISTKNLDLSRAASFERAKSRVEGEDSAMIIIFIPTGMPSIKEAVDRAIEGVPGAIALVDGVVTQKYFWFIFGQTSYVVEGTPLIDSSLASVELPSKYMVSRLDRKGNVKEFRYVSKEEYMQLKDKHISRYRQVKL